jgi:hypothetical protein
MTAKTGCPHHFLPLRSVTYPTKAGTDLRTSHLSLLLDMRCFGCKIDDNKFLYSELWYRLFLCTRYELRIKLVTCVKPSFPNLVVDRFISV